MSALKALLARLQATRAWRAWQRYGAARGGVLAGGVTYLGFFSLVPALVLGFAVFGAVLRHQPDLFARVVSTISDTLPGIVRDRAHPDGLIDASAPPAPNALTVAGAVSAVLMLLSGLGWVDALREGVRAVFGRPVLASGPVTGRLRDVAVLATLGTGLLVTGVLSTVTSAAASWLLGLVGVQDASLAGRLTLRVLATLVVLVADTALMVGVLRVLSGGRPARADVLQGALVGGIGLGVLKLASGLLLRSAANKPVLASFAVIVGLLVVLNLISRVMLISAAWTATAADDRAAALAVRSADGVPVAPSSRPLGPREDVLPSFGQRSGDRTAVLAGAVLGVSAAVAARTVREGARAAVRAGRAR
jgi:membrane protein